MSFPRQNDLRIPRTVLHRQQASLPAERHSLQLHKRRQGFLHNPSHPLDILHIVPLHERQSQHRSLRLPFTRPFVPHSTLHRLHALIEPLPVVAEQRPIELLEPLFGAPIDRDVELRHRRHASDFLRDLRVGDEDRRGPVPSAHSMGWLRTGEEGR